MARLAIEAAIAIAYEQGFPLKVEPEHLLLAILDTEQALALKVLKNLGVSIPQLREFQKRPFLRGHSSTGCYQPFQRFSDFQKLLPKLIIKTTHCSRVLVDL